MNPGQLAPTDICCVLPDCDDPGSVYCDIIGWRLLFRSWFSHNYSGVNFPLFWRTWPRQPPAPDCYLKTPRWLLLLLGLWRCVVDIVVLGVGNCDLRTPPFPSPTFLLLCCSVDPVTNAPDDDHWHCVMVLCWMGDIPCGQLLLLVVTVAGLLLLPRALLPLVSPLTLATMNMTDPIMYYCSFWPDYYICVAFWLGDDDRLVLLLKEEVGPGTGGWGWATSDSRADPRPVCVTDS